MKKIATLLAFLFITGYNFAQVKIDHVEPPFWWTGMKEHKVQLMIHGFNIGTTVASAKVKGVSIGKVKNAGNNYLFVDLIVGNSAVPGMVKIYFKKEKDTITSINYELKIRVPFSEQRKSFTSADAIYLIMPDRFSNGDPSNDDMPGMLEKADRTNPNGRHGGDIKGIKDHLGYLQKLGITAIWNTPLLENNMPGASYHGYAITDLYKIDPRFGTNDSYREMVDAAHSKGIKVIMDMVFNHYGTGHWWTKDLPQQDWVNVWPEFTRSNYRAAVLTDPYVSDYDKNKMEKGWFDTSMADFNQNNPFVANYLIQNSIWWIEFAGLDGIRQDTYPYSDKEFMAEWMKRLREEYPNFNVVGEVWMNNPSQVAYWLDKSPNKDGFRSHLTNVFDFPLMFAIQKAFNEDEGWEGGASRLYDILSQDFVYSDPLKLIVFADNHDIERMYPVLKSVENVKMALAFICTTRGIPLVYYGTEALSDRGKLEGDAGKRKDFPGGWEGDKTNFFTNTNLSADQSSVLDYMTKLLNWHKGNKVVQEGKLKHYIPENGVYVYFRTLGKESVMVIMNNSKTEKTVETLRFKENIGDFKKGKDALDGTKINDLKAITVPAKTVKIIELSR
ncbi:MAG TPA: glycoside hydrolase family 13 protein [Bacteroidales bacterium]